jgi:C1A family cysteine protease
MVENISQPNTICSFNCLKMKYFSISFFAFVATLDILSGQEYQSYEFREYKRHAATPVKSQDQTGTCWAFRTASFPESEALRARERRM